MRDKKKLGIAAGIAAAVLIVVIVAAVILTRATPQKSVQAFVSLLQEGKYEEMYDYLSSDAKERWSKEDFVARNQNIYAGVEAENFAFTEWKSEDANTGTNVSFHESMDTVIGTYAFDQSVVVVEEEDGYKINWDSSFIFPQLSDDNSISVTTLKASRGSILDRNGEAIAQDGTVYEVGFVAGEESGSSYKDLADVLDISQDTITNAMEAQWVQDGLYVPVKTISASDYEKLKEKLSAIQGIQIQETSGRVYPYGEICAHLSGYVQKASAEDLEKYADKGYTEDTWIGKSGLEAAYEEELHAQDGVSVQVVSENGQIVATIGEKAAVNGKDIKTTIDIDMQKEIYEKVKDDVGSSVAMNSKTGEVYALVSTPAYDPNDFANGMDDKTWEQLNNDEENPLLSRFQSTYCPGSTFKAITGAIGLESKTITAGTVYDKTDRWQKDDSWGDHYVTTTQQYSEDSNLANALKYSDNIFFARLADQIGAETFSSSLDALGFNETLPFELSLRASTYGENLKDEQTLAATGYGQGDLLLNPVHLTALYTAYVNEGTILQPYLIYADGESKVYKENAYSAQTAKTIFTDLQETMDHYGTNATHAAGKTGSAEVNEGKEVIGWTCAVNDQVALTVMMENTKDKGSSIYVEPIAEKILEAITK
ncbi:penicillin-binding transpeptidase domain-containing protein [Merdibacter massiliensis]|uniref:penicillin-binding transpeptidase domain-containing protein n=1 Tax=Merdibacter massiliensis TaxID=1871030 RepID=UPI00096AAE3F|nr:penicillin-binding transpeptidase domain-containing protein [Merdibacter massiliensis]